MTSIELARELKAQIHAVCPDLPDAKVVIDDPYVDVLFPWHDQDHVAILVLVPDPGSGPRYGFSIVTAHDTTGYGVGADCIFGHVPTMIQYMRRLFPKPGA